MSVKRTVSRQYAQLVDEAAKQAGGGFPVPQEGWLATLRKALGMSARQVAQRAGITKAAVYQAERNEVGTGISLRQLQKLAASMDAKLVYAIVPAAGNVKSQLKLQAHKQAERIITRAGTHMALEQQLPPEDSTAAQIEELAWELSHRPGPELWDD